MKTNSDWYDELQEKREAEKKALQEELDRLFEKFTLAELEKRFLKNFGCTNFKSDEFMHELKLARTFHDFHMKLFPELHDLHEYEKYRCYYITTCKCGFEEAADGSD